MAALDSLLPPEMARRAEDTLGNILGGTLLVGAVYWFVYLRGRGDQSS